MSDYINREEAIKTIMGPPPEAHYPSWYAEQLKRVLTVNVMENSNEQSELELKQSEGKRYCPIQLFGGNSRFAPLECIEADCRWWATYAQDCSIPLIADILADSTINQLVFKNMEDQ